MGQDRTVGGKRPPAPRSRGLRCRIALRLAAFDVLGLRALFALDYVELNRVTLGEGLEPFALDSGVVDEHVRPAVLFNEAEALAVIEPLHFSCSHWCFPLRSSRQGSPRF